MSNKSSSRLHWVRNSVSTASLPTWLPCKCGQVYSSPAESKLKKCISWFRVNLVLKHRQGQRGRYFFSPATTHVWRTSPKRQLKACLDSDPSIHSLWHQYFCHDSYYYILLLHITFTYDYYLWQGKLAAAGAAPPPLIEFPPHAAVWQKRLSGYRHDRSHHTIDEAEANGNRIVVVDYKKKQLDPGEGWYHHSHVDFSTHPTPKSGTSSHIPRE